MSFSIRKTMETLGNGKEDVTPKQKLIVTLVIALHSDVGVDVKSDRVEFLTVFMGGARIVSEQTVRINELNRRSG